MKPIVGEMINIDPFVIIAISWYTELLLVLVLAMTQILGFFWVIYVNILTCQGLALSYHRACIA